MRTNYVIYGLVIAALIAVFYQPTTVDTKQQQYTNYNFAPDGESTPITYTTEQPTEARYYQIASGEYTPAGDVILIIGASEEDIIDNPTDNQIDILIEGNIPDNKVVYLEYDLYGLEDFTSVCRSINDNVAFGGQIMKTNNEWSHQVEVISATQLRNGTNTIRFTAPEDANIKYEIKNLSIRFGEEQESSRSIEVNMPASAQYFGQYAYISGVSNGSPVSIKANGKNMRTYNGAFEGVVMLDQSTVAEKDIILTAEYADGENINKRVILRNSTSYDYMDVSASNVSFKQYFATPQNAIDFSMNGFALHGAAGSVMQQLNISITGLRTEDMPMLDADMYNVTAQDAGYRCLPHGEHFANGVQITIAYDSAAIPSGYGPDDIRTFYYNESTMEWVMLPVDSVDYENHCIVSTTTHFTDFINSILKTPESPQTEAFTPTSMKDMKYADPLAGINIMSPPSANNMGTANMSYPIQIPAGRQGMQPQLAITYNSEGGNGPLGMGWNLNTPAITVDTRWGVPRYDDTYETEEYLVNGEQVVELYIDNGDTTRLPLVHQDVYRDRNPSLITNYSYRVEGAFHRIIRHEESPAKYWWEVVDKQGTRYYYGKYSDDSSVNPNCVLRDGGGNIAHWALAEVRDIYGNYVKYYYDFDDFQGSPGTNGKQIYISRIEYTGIEGAVSELPKYSVEFTYTQGRPDYQISGRYGFLEVTNWLLESIDITYNGDFIRRYYLKYKDGVYDKKLICAIADVTELSSWPAVTNVELTCNDFASLKGGLENVEGVKIHSFEYYEDYGIEFEPNSEVVYSINDPSNSFFNGQYTVPEDQSLGRSYSTSGGAGGSFCFGIGNPTNKTNSIGANFSFGVNSIKEKIQILDINGDGLKDKLVRVGNSFTYYKGYIDPTTNYLYFSTTGESITDLPNLGLNWSLSMGAGGEIQVGVSSLSCSASLNGTLSYSSMSRYFTDLNADGYLDYYDQGQFYFNYPDEISNDPVFTPETSEIQVVGTDTCYAIIHDGDIDPSFAETAEDFEAYRRDPVRMWIAPDVYNGATVEVISDIVRTNAQTGLSHDIVYEIQHNDAFVACGTIGANDYTPRNNTYIVNNVQEGDRIYFRILCDDNMGLDEVAWNTEIHSLNGQANPTPVDADDKPIFDFKYEDDAVIHDDQYFIAPMDGTISISGSIASPAQSDDLTFVIEKIGSTTTTLLNTTYTDGSSFSQILNYTNISVSAGDIIKFELISNTNVNWSEIDFDAHIQYDAPAYNPIEYYPPLTMTIFPKRNLRSWPVTTNVDGYDFEPVLDFGANALNANGYITFAVKSNRKLIDEVTFEVIAGVVDGSPSVLVTQAPGEVIYFEFYTNDLDLSTDVTVAQAKHLDENGVAISFNAGYHSVFDPEMKLYGNLYRGWGQFSYYDAALATCPNPPLINQSLLSLDLAGIDETTLASFPVDDISATSTFSEVQDIFTTFGIPDIHTLYFVPMMADRENGKWVDFCKSAYTDEIDMGSGALYDEVLSMVDDPEIFDPTDGPLPDFFNPLGTQNGMIREFNKNSKQVTGSFSFNASVGVTVGTTITNTTSYGSTEFMDMNGDRYPDYVNKNQIQYTTPYGGISNDVTSLDNTAYPSKGKSNSNGLSLGISGFIHKSSISSLMPISKLNDVKGNFGLGVTNSSSEVNEIYTDVNGDGLPDRVDKLNNTVSFNIGYDFEQPQLWHVDEVSVSSSLSESVSGGIGYFNFWQDSWSGGIGLGNSDGNDEESMMDVNNDGLLDICVTDGSGIHAYINTGHSYTPTTIVMNSSYQDYIKYTKSYDISGNVAATFGISVVLFKTTFSPYLNISYNISNEKQKLDDLNGDGFVDYVYLENNTTTGVVEIKVNYGKPMKTNMLKKVTTPAQSTYTMDYKIDLPDRDNPSPRWTMASLDIYDGFIGDGDDHTYYEYEYANAYHHRMERDFFGYATVTTKQMDNTNTCYRKTQEDFHNDYFLFKGLKKHDVLTDGSGAITYIETFYTWDHKQISDGKIIDPEDECFGPYYPAISHEEKLFYEGGGTAQIISHKTWRHGPFGNVKEYVNYGDSAYSEDNVIAKIYYIYDPTLYDSDNLTEMISELLVYDEGGPVNGTLLRRRTAIYDQNPASIFRGKVKSIIAFEGTDEAWTDITYNDYGGLKTIEYPENDESPAKRLRYSYEYDPYVHTYPTRIEDYWGNYSTAYYDVKLGLPLEIYDISGNAMKFTYDGSGRIKTITGPNEVMNGDPYTISCSYWDELNAGGTGLWAQTSHFDPINTANHNEFVTVNFSDGLGRSIQSKKKIIENVTEMVLVSGLQEYTLNSNGQVITSYQPLSEYPGHETDLDLTMPWVNPTVTEMDILDRTTKQTLPDGNIYTYNYDFGSFGMKTYFTTKVIDPELNEVSQYTDARGLKSRVATYPLVTHTDFTYSPMGELLTSTDPENNSTYYYYDMLGRLTSRVHPDAGTTTYTYDMAGNVLTTQTQNLANNGGLEIVYNYLDNRLDNIHYPENPEMDVFYEYGSPTALNANNRGRLIRMQDASGVQTFEYGNMGELVTNIHTFVVPGGDAYTFETNWEYDSWNRVKNITYPDGEIVSYGYNDGGQLTTMNSVKGSEVYDFITDIKYDKYGMRTDIYYGNGTRTEYTYDQQTLRLDNLKSYDIVGNLMQNLDYTYDDVGNITTLENTAGNLSGIGGNYTYTFGYDNLYRLLTATGNADIEPASTNLSLNYTLGMTYTQSGNIETKSLVANTFVNGQVTNVNYNHFYNYPNPQQPHAVREVGSNTYFWDANGNMTMRYSKAGSRFLCWDEENRLTTVHDEGANPILSSYIYDAGGERVWKLSNHESTLKLRGKDVHRSMDLNKTLYISPLMVMTDKEYTKHYFIEGERVCTKVGGGFFYAPTDPDDVTEQLDFFNGQVADDVAADLWQMMSDGITCSGYDVTLVEVGTQMRPAKFDTKKKEKLLYFYHPDHLGSSSFITDAAGEAEEHLQYLPFGEIFVQQQAPHSDYDTRYKFSAKELDPETNYTYFGARYYDSDLSIWLSVDQMSDKYPEYSPYMYVGGNPVMITDPNGMDWFVDEETGNIYYNSRIGKDNMDQLKGTAGEGYTWLGENDMFGYTEDEMKQAMGDEHGWFAQNADFYYSYSLSGNEERNSVEEAHFSGENAEMLMGAFGYQKVVTQATVHEQYLGQGDGQYTYHAMHLTQINEKYSYVPKSHTESLQIVRTQSLNNGIPKEMVFRAKFIYGQNQFYDASETGKNLFREIISGDHQDLAPPKFYQNWGEYPNNNSLINKFRRLYGTK